MSGRLCIFKENIVYEAQRKVILEIAEKESCVIIGRNADFILKDKDNVLNVFIHVVLNHLFVCGLKHDNSQ